MCVHCFHTDIKGACHLLVALPASQRRSAQFVEELIRLGVRHAPGWPLPNQKHDNAPTSAEALGLLHSAWPNGNILALTRSEYRLYNPEAKDFPALLGRESVQYWIQPAAWRAPLRHPDRPERSWKQSVSMSAWLATIVAEIEPPPTLLRERRGRKGQGSQAVPSI